MFFVCHIPVSITISFLFDNSAEKGERNTFENESLTDTVDGCHLYANLFAFLIKHIHWIKEKISVPPIHIHSKKLHIASSFNAILYSSTVTVTKT